MGRCGTIGGNIVTQMQHGGRGKSFAADEHDLSERICGNVQLLDWLERKYQSVEFSERFDRHSRSYDYLGLGTVVRRSHPQPAVDLTFLGTGPGSGGDQYVGLDSFGRVIDQNSRRYAGRYENDRRIIDAWERLHPY